MSIYEKLLSKHNSLAVIGLGYVGMPLAIEFAKKGINVIGYDVNVRKIQLYKDGIDPTCEVGSNEIKQTKVFFTSDEKYLQNVSFFIVAVPTPVNMDHTPDLTPVIAASKIVGRNMPINSIVVYESTVYPGCTESVCVPILEETSGLICGKDFKIGYSPERINPGDKIHRLSNIKKIVSGCDRDALTEIRNIYDIVISAGTYPASNIRTAEAIKVVENSQRDINIAFMNELAMVFDKMDIDTNEVVDGMNTKWNALGFRPGLVGGHCIGVDPYYFTYQAEKLGYHSQIILNGRIVNDSMGSFIANSTIKEIVKAGLSPTSCKIAILGITFKENCPDIRNSKVHDIISELNKFNVYPYICDPIANKDDVKKVYKLGLTDFESLYDIDCCIFAVAHNSYKILIDENSQKLIDIFNKNHKPILIDVKNLIRKDSYISKLSVLWKL